MIGLAKYGADTVVYFKTCMMFSTEDGDAWLLDVEAGAALCLCWKGRDQMVNVSEREDAFFVEYDSSYSVRSGNFVVASDSPQIGQRMIFGAYPVSAIAEFERAI